MRVAVTGASGHIGANLVRALLAQGDEVRALIHTDSFAIEGLPVERIPGDLCRDDLRSLLDGVEVVYHLAGVISIDGDPSGAVQAVNVEGARRLAQAALDVGVRRFIHTSSIHAFAEEPLDAPVTEDSPRDPAASAAYNRSKALGEAAVREVGRQGLDVVVVHPTGILGPWDHQPSHLGKVLINVCRRRLPATVPGGFNWVDVRDVVHGLLQAAERGRSQESYILGGTWAAVSELVGMAAEIVGVRPPPMHLPLWTATAGLPFIRTWCAVTGLPPVYTRESIRALQVYRDIRTDKAGRDLHYAPRPLRETMVDTLRWFADHGRIPPFAYGL